MAISKPTSLDDANELVHREVDPILFAVSVAFTPEGPLYSEWVYLSMRDAAARAYVERQRKNGGKPKYHAVYVTKIEAIPL